MSIRAVGLLVLAAIVLFSVLGFVVKVAFWALLILAVVVAVGAFLGWRGWNRSTR